jgi:hypothetical protein
LTLSFLPLAAGFPFFLSGFSFDFKVFPPFFLKFYSVSSKSPRFGLSKADDLAVLLFPLSALAPA